MSTQCDRGRPASRLKRQPSTLHLALGLAALQVADLATTWLALNAGAVEANKIVLWLGWPLAAALKGGIAATIVWGASKYWVHRQVLLFVVCMYVAVCVLNVMAWQAA